MEEDINKLIKCTEFLSYFIMLALLLHHAFDSVTSHSVFYVMLLQTCELNNYWWFLSRYMMN